MVNAVAINGALRNFATEKANARKFHRQTIGKDVNPDCCFGDWLWKVAHRDYGGIRKTYGASLDKEFGSWLDETGCRSKAALSVSAGGASGGYLVPQQLRDSIMAAVVEDAIIRPRAKVVKMDSATLLLPLPDATTAPSAAGIAYAFGGIQMQWTQEAATRPETEPKFRQIELRAVDLAGEAFVSNPMMEDAVGIESWLFDLFAKSIAWYEDFAFIRGSGVGQPVGMLNSGALKTITRSGSGAFAAADLSGMLKAFLPASWKRGIWINSNSLWDKIVVLATSGWQMNQPVSEANPAKGYPFNILAGLPQYTTEKLPAIGTTGDIMLIDPGLYVIGDRQAIEIDVSSDEPTAFQKNQSIWRVIERVDGQPYFSKVITLQDASTTVSPFVCLSTL